MIRTGWVELEEADGRIKERYVGEAAGRPDVAGIVTSFSQRVEVLEKAIRFLEVRFRPGGAPGRDDR